MKQKVKYSIIFSAISLGVGGLSTIFTRKNMGIYNEINQPFFSPPAWLFPIVWAVLYILMGISLGIALTSPRRADEKKNARIYFGLHLAVNFFWSIIFFNLQMFKWSFVWLCLLLALIIFMTQSFFKLSKVAGYLQIPYIVWVFFAGLLNFSIAILN